MTAAQFVAFARYFGPPEPHVIEQFHHPENANILVLSNVKKGPPTGCGRRHVFSYDYSTSMCRPPHAAIFNPGAKPSGDTLFANQYAAYDGLPGALKSAIEGLVAIHHYGNRDDLDPASRTAASPLSAEQWSKMPVVRHRIARPHPRTGRIALYAVSGSSFGIVGMPDDEAVALLDELKEHATQKKYQYCLKYHVGDVVIWDNASLLHSATLTDPDDPRTLYRITIKETVPLK